MNGGLAVVTGLVGLGMGLALAPKSASAAPAGPVVCVKSDQAARWANARGLHGVLVDKTADVVHVVKEAVLVVDGSNCDVYSWSDAATSWQKDAAKTDDLKSFLKTAPATEALAPAVAPPSAADEPTYEAVPVPGEQTEPAASLALWNWDTYGNRWVHVAYLVTSGYNAALIVTRLNEDYGGYFWDVTAGRSLKCIKLPGGIPFITR